MGGAVRVVHGVASATQEAPLAGKAAPGNVMFVQAPPGGGWPPFYQFGGGGHTIVIGRQPGDGGAILPNLPIGLSRGHAPLAWGAATGVLQWSNTSPSG